MDILGNLQKVISFVFRAGKSTVTIQGAADLKSQDPGKDIVINVRDGALDQNLVTDSSIDTLTNKTIDSASNTITIDADLATVSNIDDDNIRAGGVGTVSMADDAVTNDKIATDAVNADSIADNAIDTAAIQNGAVTDAKITAVDSTKATYSNVSSGLVATNVQAAIDEVEGRVDASETALSDHLLDAIDAHDASAISFDPSSNSLTATELQTLGAEIATRLDTADTNISNNDTDITNLQNDKADKSTAINTTGSLTGGGDLSTSRTLDVADGGIDTTELADDSVTKEKINPDVAGVGLGQNVDGSLEVNVDDSTIETNVDTLRVKSSGITANELANDSVDAAAIQTDAVTTDKILNSNVTGDKIASNAITVAKIADGAISDAKVNDVGANKITGSFPEFYLDSGSTAIVANVITLPADASHFTVTGGGPLNNITSVGSLTDRYFQLQNTSGGAISITNGSGIITGTGANLTWEDEATLIFYNNGTDNVICGGSGSGTGGGIATVFVTHSTIPATLEVDKRYLVDISGGNATASMPASSALNDGKVIEVWPVNNPGGGTVTLNAAASHNFNDPDLGSDSQYILDVGSAEFVIRDTGDLYEVRDAYWSAGFDINFEGPGTIPLGSIIPVVDAYSNVTVPASGVVDSRGFQYCDGAALSGESLLGTGLSGNTPNLTDGRFLRGSTVSGTTGGNSSISLSVNNIPAHTHTMNHGHADTFSTGVNSVNHTHNIVFSRVGINSGGGGTTYEVLLGRSVYPALNTRTETTNTVSATHTHAINGSVTDFTGSTDSTGSGTAFSIEPQYLNVKYLIRVK
jgi:hypothetical protein